jgi:hypothetical protein
MRTRHEIERYNQRLDRIGWSLAAIVTGGVLLWQAPFGVWLIGASLILLGMNMTRLIQHIPMSNFTLVLGITALIMGSGFARGVNLLLIPRLLVVGGLVSLFKTLSRGLAID